MSVILLAIVVGTLFATGTYLVLRRRPIQLLLGLGLLSYGINLLLFSSGKLKRGAPPILDKATFTGDLDQMSSLVDPLPQALILTAIVISFGVTAFTVVLVNQRNALMKDARLDSRTRDPFAIQVIGSNDSWDYNLDNDDPEGVPDDYEWLEYDLADEYLQKLEQKKMAKAARNEAESPAQNKGSK